MTSKGTSPDKHNHSKTTTTFDRMEILQTDLQR